LLRNLAERITQMHLSNDWILILLLHAFKELRYGQAGCINAFKQRQDIV